MADKLEERLLAKRETGFFNGGRVFARIGGKDYRHGGEPIMELVNPDGPAALDEITRLNAENAELHTLVEEFRHAWEASEALVDEMREGLEPFAKAYDEIADGKAVWIERPINDDGSLMIQHFRQARSLIAKAQPPVSHD